MKTVKKVWEVSIPEEIASSVGADQDENLTILVYAWSCSFDQAAGSVFFRYIDGFEDRAYLLYEFEWDHHDHDRIITANSKASIRLEYWGAASLVAADCIRVLTELVKAEGGYSYDTTGNHAQAAEDKMNSLGYRYREPNMEEFKKFTNQQVAKHHVSRDTDKNHSTGYWRNK